MLAHLACRIGARAQAGQGNAWPAVVSIAVGVERVQPYPIRLVNWFMSK